MKIRLGTRKSKLALAQAAIVASKLKEITPGLEVEIHEIITIGDVLKTEDLSKMGGKGLFLKEIEEQLLAHEIDIAVHSMKDVPAYLPKGLIIDCVLEREDPRDVFISMKYSSLADMPRGGIVGTSSARRRMQIRALRDDLECVLLRGNVTTRIKKVEAGEFDGIILAAAGLNRLSLSHYIKQYMSVGEMLPAIAQGVIGVECRIGDAAVVELLAKINHVPTFREITLERKIMQAMNADCGTPIAAYALKKGNTYIVKAGYAKSTTESQMKYTEFNEDELFAENIVRKLVT